MNNELEKLLSDHPMEVKFENIVDFDNLDERVSCIEVITSNIVGVNDGFIEFCPNDEPAVLEEILPWIWLFRPDLGKEILKQSKDGDFSKLIGYYDKNELDKWREYIT